jgi:hypothetical protein
LRARIVPPTRSQDDPRAQVAELLGGIAPVEHVEDVLELRARELGVGVGARDERVEVVDVERGLVVAIRGRRHRDDLLGEDIEGVARDHRRLDQAFAHAPGDHRALEQVGAELGEDPALARLPDVVAGAADPLQAGGHRLWRLHLQDQVDGAHVDAQLERARGHEARQLAGLELLLDDEALLAREGAVMGPRRSALSASSLRRSASRSAPRRLLTKTSVERWLSTSSRSFG